MSTKTKKSKKKPKPVNDVIKIKDTTVNKKIHAYFTNEEIGEIKTVLKIKDVTTVPFATAATILYKFDLLKKLLKDGYNINQTGQNNLTALMWAVKYKHLDIVDYLLNNGADPTIKTDSGDNVLILALEHKLWDEQSLIKLWKAVKRVSYVDINFTNKNGHNLLHMCVRRDWEELLHLLLNEKPNIDAGNSNGVTPLMLACFRNNINIIEILIQSGADILKEDNHGRMTLCYAISSAMKVNKPPFLATDKIITELRKKNLIDTYLKRRLELIITTGKKSEISCATSEMLIKIIQFAVQFIEGSVEIFLECDVFVELLEILKKRLDNNGITKFLLEVCEEILFYEEQSLGYKMEVHGRLLQNFYTTGWTNTIMEILPKHIEESKVAFNILTLALTNEEQYKKVLEENSETLLVFLNDPQTYSEDENKVKILKNRKRRLKKMFDSLDLSTLPQTDSSEKMDEKKKCDTNCSKKSRRRSKAIKAKLTKIKSAELTKRLNLNGKKVAPQKTTKISATKTDSEETIEFLPPLEGDFLTENPIAASFQHLLEAENDTSDKKTPIEGPKWKQQLKNMVHSEWQNFPIEVEKLHQAVDQLNQKYDARSVNVIVDYLRQLLQMLVRKYREHWEHDRASGNCTCLELNEHVPWLYNCHLKNVEAREKQTIQELQKIFENFIKVVKELALKDLPQCVENLNKIESMLLNYEVRGIKLFSYICEMEAFTMKYSTMNPRFNTKTLLGHVQNVLNDIEEPRKDISIEVIEESEDVTFVETYKTETPLELYHREMSLISKPKLKNKRKEIEAKLNTIANGFHLINSIMSVCDDSPTSDTDQQSESKGKKKEYTISQLNYPLRNDYQKTLHCPDISEFMPKGLMSQISTLKQLNNFQKLLEGEIRISPREQKYNYMISSGINFTAAELGLDINDQPVVVKRVPKESWFGRMIKTLVEPLLGLIHTHILHYFACEYEGNELILVTPICKWNLAQYMQLLKQCSVTTIPMTTIDTVKQFLNGLMVLHKCEVPVVHGNLKPTNIFVDFNGVIKIGEFGIYKALYKIVEAPKSSLIWFAKETLHIYKNSSIMDCTFESDIYVGGMLIYFILSYGKHPFGEETLEILRGIKKGNPKLNTRNVDLKDMLLWMMLNDSTERPSIEQVLAHPFFWLPSKKWSFVLRCSGVNQTSYILPINVDKLHRSIDTYCEAYIKIDWHDIIKAKFPSIRVVENNTVIGLLKFIKNCQEHQNETNLTDAELSCAILSLFPSLPVALYRTLQNTNWLKHAIFIEFSEVF